MAEDIGLALNCDSLTTNTTTPLPYAPSTLDRGRGTHEMLIETGLGPSKTTARGAPRTRLLSKLQSALGTLRPVIRWARKAIGPGNLHSTTRKAKQKLTQLGVIPLHVRQDWDAGCRRLRKIGRLVCKDLCLQDVGPFGP